MSTLKDVAALAGVSSWTASKVLSGDAQKAKIGAVCARRVVAAARKLQYRPNRQASVLRKGKTRVIGILMGAAQEQDEYWNSFCGVVVAGMEQGIRSCGYDALMIGASKGVVSAEIVHQYFGEKRMDGLLIPEHACSSQLPSAIADTPGPVVLAGCSGPMSMPQVLLDDGAGIQAAVRHLAELGHRRILWLSFSPTGHVHHSVVDRRDAFWSAIREGALAGDELLLAQSRGRCSQLSSEPIRVSREVCLASWPQIRSSTAVVCYNERLALGVYAAAHERGICVPKELSVVGFDDLIADMAWPAMTTISHCLGEIGRQSALLAIELSGEPGRWPVNPAPCIQVPATLVVRESTAAPPRLT